MLARQQRRDVDLIASEMCAEARSRMREAVAEVARLERRLDRLAWLLRFANARYALADLFVSPRAPRRVFNAAADQRVKAMIWQGEILRQINVTRTSIYYERFNYGHAMRTIAFTAAATNLR